jgi:hypothetical protein
MCNVKTKKCSIWESSEKEVYKRYENILFIRFNSTSWKNVTFVLCQNLQFWHTLQNHIKKKMLDTKSHTLMKRRDLSKYVFLMHAKS